MEWEVEVEDKGLQVPAGGVGGKLDGVDVAFDKCLIWIRKLTKFMMWRKTLQMSFRMSLKIQPINEKIL